MPLSRGKYVIDPQTSVWHRRDLEYDFNYSDGDDAEGRIERCIRESEDVSAGSAELCRGISDWPTLYHLSPQRLNLLRPLAPYLGGRTLEIGSGCGAVTRYLAELGSAVVALEGSPRRAAITAARCRGLQDVTVVCDNFASFATKEKFDCITLIGVLEYSRVFVEDPDPVGAVLSRCRDMLARGGVLIVAIENQLGLKYFAGAPEDHFGVPFWGINNQYTEKSVETFGKRELEGYLNRAGFQAREFLYPLPDYKLPQVVVHPSAFRSAEHSVADLVQSCAPAHDQNRNYARLFSEKRAWELLMRNGIAEDLANSFLLVATQDTPAKPLVNPNVLAYSYASIRRKCYQKQNLVVNSRNGLAVKRRKLYRNPQPVSGPYRQEILNEPLLSGRLFVSELHAILNTPGWSFEAVGKWTREYLDFLLLHAEPDADHLPPRFVDCSPSNLIRSADGSLNAFDLEWIADGPVALDYVLFRGLFYALNGSITIAPCAESRSLNIFDLIRDLLQSLERVMTDAGLEAWLEKEERLQKFVVGPHATLDRQYWQRSVLVVRHADIQQVVLNREGEINRLNGELGGLRSALVELEAQIAALKDGAAHREVELQRIIGEIGGLQSTIAERESQIAVLSDFAAQRETEIQRLNGEAGALQSSIAEREFQIALNESASEPHRQVAALTEINTAREAELERLHAGMEELRHAIAGRERQISTLQGEATSRNGVVLELKEQISGLKIAVTERDRQVLILNSYSDQATREIATLSRKLTRHENEPLRRAEAVEELQTTIGRQENRLVELATSVALREGETRRIRREIDRLHEEVLERERRLAGFRETAAVREAEALRLHDEIGGLRNTIDVLKNAAASNTSEAGRLCNELSGLRGILAERDLRIADLQNLNGERESALRRLEDELHELRQTAGTLTESLAGSEHKTQLLADEIAAAHNSLSWRLTAPLRIVRDHLGLPNGGPDLSTGFTRRWLLSSRLRMKASNRKLISTIQVSGLFDESYYTRRYPDVVQSGLDPLTHYMIFGAREHRDPGPLFDAAFYCERNPDAAKRGVNPLGHYLTTGAAAGYPPNRLFDPAFYLKQCPEMPQAASDPLSHYLSTGASLDLDPHPLFDTSFYLEENPDVAASPMNPLAHYLDHGGSEGRNPHPLFASSYYLKRYPDVAAQGVNPLVHYLRTGASEGRDPHPLFQTERYLRRYPEVAAAGLNPLVDFLIAGVGAGRNPHPLFETSFYLENNSDLAGVAINPLVHYLDHGGREGRQPHPLFDGRYYLELNRDVAGSGVNPLVHYLCWGATEDRDPHPLFDTSYYLEQNPDVAESGINPLVHYVCNGAFEHRSPHPLFDVAFYIGQQPEAGATDVDPLLHYMVKGVANKCSPHPLFDAAFYLNRHPHLTTDPLRHYLMKGAEAGDDPHELFDSSFYLAQYPDVAQAGINPLLHYVTRGAAQGRNPNSLFHTAFYRKEHLDVAKSGMDPLTHFVLKGVWEGYDPNPFFDTVYYLKRYEDVRNAKVNPLAHYLTMGGAGEGRDPSPLFDASRYVKEHPEVAASGTNPLAHFLASGATTPIPVPAQAGKPVTAPPAQVVLRVKNLGHPKGNRAAADRFRPARTVLCVSHVSPYPPQAGNKYRLYRLLRWLRSAGYRIVLALAPLPDDPVSHEQVRKLALEFQNVILCERDGEIAYSMEEGGNLVRSIDGATVPPYFQQLGEDKLKDRRLLELLNIDRTFCHEALIHLMVRLRDKLGSCAVLAEYIFMSRVLPLLPSGTLKIIDTHDVFSTKHKKVVQFGIEDSIGISTAEERDRLVRSDLILAIQPLEEVELREIAPTKPVITIGVDFDTSAGGRPLSGRKIICVASGNPMNVKGVRDFLSLAWPWISREVPDAEFLVAGPVCRAVKSTDPRVKLLGLVDDIHALYQQAKVAINPAVAGTGVKIKTLEALCQFRPLVTWPTGVDGVDPQLASLCCTAEDWYGFHRRVVEVLNDPRPEWFDAGQRKLISDRLSPSVVYAPLRERLDAFFKPRKADGR